MEFQHKELSREGWSDFSLAEQMGNIGSEVNRALKWQDKDPVKFKNSSERALELLDFTIQDTRWKDRLSEIVRAREVLCDALNGGKTYQSSLEDMDRYFFSFAMLARMSK